MDDIEELKGIGDATAKKLKSAGYSSLIALATATPSELSERADIGEETANKLVKDARKKLALGFQTGESVEEDEKKVKYISTGCKSLDAILGGGVSTGYITEFYGPYGSAKTQLALQLAVNVQLPEEQGGLSKQAIFIDTENTFIAKRIKQMIEAKKLDVKTALNNIHVGKAYSTSHQEILANDSRSICENNDIGLLIVDSLTSQYRSEFIGREQLATRQQKLNQFMRIIQNLAVTYNIAVVVTNQVLSDPANFFGDPTRPVGGHVVGHRSAFRIYLTRTSKLWKARLVDSPFLPNAETTFQVTEDGVIDCDE